MFLDLHLCHSQVYEIYSVHCSSAQLNSVGFDMAIVKSSESAYDFLFSFFPDSSYIALKLLVREIICLCNIVEVFGHVPLSKLKLKRKLFSLEIDCSDFSIFLSSSGILSEARWRGCFLLVLRSCILSWWFVLL